MGTQYFNLREALGVDEPAPLPTTEDIAEALKSESWT